MTPLYERFTALAGTLNDAEDLVTKYRSCLSEGMSLEDMQAAINELAQYIKQADQKLLDIHNDRVARSEAANSSAKSFNRRVKQIVDRLLK